MLSAIDQLLQRPNSLAWLMLVAAALLAVIAACSLLALGTLIVVAKQLSGRASLAEELQPVLDRGDLDDVINRCRMRLADFPDDVVAHYFIGLALRRRGDLKQALPHLRRVPELHAGWDVAAMISAVESELVACEQREPDLKVVHSQRREDETKT